ncbi:MAG TPA: type III-B CRISPR module RAMP protein Cmr6 [Saprospirales bacterium]|nr:type III-B CRISPR module RAMP protein Cmr6 [Saprospirales bacterium]
MNLRHFFYRGYYQGLDYQKIISGKAKTDSDIGAMFARKNHQLLDYSATESALALLAPAESGLDQLNGYTEILLQTGGQGLLSGSGYNHETGSMGELKLGFYFDPTSGLPTLPGHSVKGVLRAAFPGKNESDSIKNAKARWIAKVLQSLEVAIPEGEELGFVEKLKTTIFERDASIAVSGHDIFLEAAMIRPGRFLGRDALAPHDRKTNGLKNPVPIPFIKVLPGTPFRFAFLLKPATIEGLEVSVNAKKVLFEAILTTFGAGAKTRGGYGVFEKIKAAPAPPKESAAKGLVETLPASRFKSLPLKSTNTYEAVINGKNDKGKTRFVLLVGEIGKGLTFTQKWAEELPEGSIIQVRLVLNMNGQIQELKPA